MCGTVTQMCAAQRWFAFVIAPLLSFIQITKNNNFSHELFQYARADEHEDGGGGRTNDFPLKALLRSQLVLNFLMKGASGMQVTVYHLDEFDVTLKHAVKRIYILAQWTLNGLIKGCRLNSPHHACMQMQPDFKLKLNRNSLLTMLEDCFYEKANEKLSHTASNLIVF